LLIEKQRFEKRSPKERVLKREDFQSAINNQQSRISSRWAITSVTFQPRISCANIYLMSTGTGSAKYRCAQCEQSEESCQCEKYCCLCQSVIDVRMCTDGLLYCEPCRSACDYKTAD
jgi:hypothetical protein